MLSVREDNSFFSSRDVTVVKTPRLLKLGSFVCRQLGELVEWFLDKLAALTVIRRSMSRDSFPESEAPTTDDGFAHRAFFPFLSLLTLLDATDSEVQTPWTGSQALLRELCQKLCSGFRLTLRLSCMSSTVAPHAHSC